jgi:hypothetical protein
MILHHVGVVFASSETWNLSPTSAPDASAELENLAREIFD